MKPQNEEKIQSRTTRQQQQQQKTNKNIKTTATTKNTAPNRLQSSIKKIKNKSRNVCVM